MNYNKLMMEYFDGGIDSGGEDVLFAALAGDSELRLEFNQYVKLHSVAQADLVSISPSSDITNSIFSQLGFGVPNKSYLENNSSPAMHSSKNLSSLLVLFFAAFMAAGLYFFESVVEPNSLAELNNKNQSTPIISSFSNDDDNDADSQEMMNRQSSNFGETNENSYELFSHSNNLNNSSNRISFNENSARSVLNNEDATSNDLKNRKRFEFIRLDNNSNFDSFASAVYNEQIVANFTDQHKNSSKRNYTYIDELANGNIYSNNFKPSKVAIEFRQLSGSSNPDIRLNESSNFLTDNFSFAFRYNIHKEHQFGAEIGIEKFPQTFTISETNSSQNQNPDLFWYGLSYRYVPYYLKFAEYFNPYGQILVGGTVVGPLYKMQTGLSYTPIGSFNMMLGLEYGGLLYNVEGNIYHTNKYGIFYGISLSF